MKEAQQLEAILGMQAEGVRHESRKLCAAASEPPVTSSELPVRDVAASEFRHRHGRKDSRYGVDDSASILLVRVGSTLRGRVLDLSLSGCRIRTEDRFPLGIYTRIETEFRVQGVPFRLGGVIQAIHDCRTVGIRFLDLSERKRQQINELIQELREAGAAHPG